MAMGVTAVFFDVGETLVDESRLWRGWARYLGIADAVFFAALNDVIAGGEHHRKVFDRLRAGLDIDAARRERAARGDHDLFCAADLYPDAIPCLRRLKDLGYQTGIAGNQPEGAVAVLHSIGAEVDFITASANLGVEKPSPAFFQKLADMAGVEPSRIAHVGDRLDNDILPAKAIGMRALFVARGPWGNAHAQLPDVALADATLRSLTDVPAALAALR